VPDNKIAIAITFDLRMLALLSCLKIIMSNVYAMVSQHLTLS
jgi:hypothetical protein